MQEHENIRLRKYIQYKDTLYRWPISTDKVMCNHWVNAGTSLVALAPTVVTTCQPDQ